MNIFLVVESQKLIDISFVHVDMEKPSIGV